jgi:hypothetical protein
MFQLEGITEAIRYNSRGRKLRAANDCLYLKINKLLLNKESWLMTKGLCFILRIILPM